MGAYHPMIFEAAAATHKIELFVVERLFNKRIDDNRNFELLYFVLCLPWVSVVYTSS